MKENEKVELTALQRALLDKKLFALLQDFGAAGVAVQFKDGSCVVSGDIAMPDAGKKRNRKSGPRNFPPGYKMGELTRATQPWVELANSSPNEEIKIRPSDFPGFELARVQSNMVALANRLYGAGSFTTRKVHDEVEGVAALIQRLDPPRPAAYTGKKPKAPVQVPANRWTNGVGEP